MGRKAYTRSVVVHDGGPPIANVPPLQRPIRSWANLDQVVDYRCVKGDSEDDLRADCNYDYRADHYGEDRAEDALIAGARRKAKNDLWQGRLYVDPQDGRIRESRFHARRDKESNGLTIWLLDQSHRRTSDDRPLPIRFPIREQYFLLTEEPWRSMRFWHSMPQITTLP